MFLPWVEVEYMQDYDRDSDVSLTAVSAGNFGHIDHNGKVSGRCG